MTNDILVSGLTETFQNGINMKLSDQQFNNYYELLQFVMLVANGIRPDGTYNYCREALEIKAKEVLLKINQ